MILESVRLATRLYRTATCAQWIMSLGSQYAQNATKTSPHCKMGNVPFARITGHLTIALTRSSVSVLTLSSIRCSLTSIMTTNALLATS